MNTIYILWLREIKRYFRSRTRMIGSIGQPLLFLLALGFGLGPVFQRAGQGNYFEFLAPGVIAMGILFTAVFSGIQIIWDRQFGFLKETLVAPVSRFNIMLGKTLGGATIATLQGCVVFFLALIIGFRPYSLIELPIALFVMLLIAILFTGLGVTIASVLEDINGFQLIMNFLVQPLFFLSGALYPLKGLPGAFKIITSIDPLTYGVDALRTTLANTGQYNLLTDIGVLIILIFIVLSLGSYFFSRLQI